MPSPLPYYICTTESAGRAFKMTPVVCKKMQKCKFSTMLAWQYFVALGTVFPVEKYSQLPIRCNLCKEAIFSYFSLLLLNIFTIPHYCTLCKKETFSLLSPLFVVENSYYFSLKAVYASGHIGYIFPRLMTIISVIIIIVLFI